MEEPEKKYVPAESRVGVGNHSENSTPICFLCLKDISPELNILNRMGGSLFKLEKFSSAFTTFTPAVPEKFSLLKICRYLLGKQQDTEIFSVNLCQQCRKVCSKMTDLCTELELLQMKINHQLKIFSEVMGQSGSQSEDLHHSVLKPLREKLKQECHRKLKDIFPKVMLVRDDSLFECFATNPVPTFSEYSPEPHIPDHFSDDSSEVPPSSNATTSASCPSSAVPPPVVYFSAPKAIPPPFKVTIDSKTYWRCPNCPSKYIERAQLYQHQRIKHGLNLPRMKPGRQKKPPKEKMCDLCTPPRKFKAMRLKRHQIVCHVETFFSHLKSPQISPPDFKKYCDNAFKSETFSSQIVSNSEGVPCRQCPYCSVMYHEIKSLRAHYFFAHKEIMEGKISNLQKSGTVHKIKQFKPSGSDMIKCDACGNTFSYRFSLQQHKKHYCKHGPKIKVPARQQRKCVPCSRYFETEEKRLEHRLLMHPDIKPKIKKPPGTSFNKCVHCTPPRDFQATIYKRHQISKHIEIFFEERKLPKVTMEQFKVYCEDAFKLEMMAGKIVEGKDGERTECSQCEERFQYDYCLRRHLFAEHKEVMEGKILELQESCTVEEVDEEEEDEDWGRRKEIVECEACGKSFAGKIWLAKHMEKFCEFRDEYVANGGEEAVGVKMEGVGGNNVEERQPVNLLSEFIEDAEVD